MSEIALSHRLREACNQIARQALGTVPERSGHSPLVGVAWALGSGSPTFRSREWFLRLNDLAHGEPDRPDWLEAELEHDAVFFGVLGATLFAAAARAEQVSEPITLQFELLIAHALRQNPAARRGAFGAEISVAIVEGLVRSGGVYRSCQRGSSTWASVQRTLRQDGESCVVLSLLCSGASVLTRQADPTRPGFVSAPRPSRRAGEILSDLIAGTDRSRARFVSAPRDSTSAPEEAPEEQPSVNVGSVKQGVGPATEFRNPI